MGREILLLTAYFEHSVGLRSDTNANLMQDVFSHERWEVSFLVRTSTFRQAYGKI